MKCRHFVKSQVKIYMSCEGRKKGVLGGGLDEKGRGGRCWEL
jgi:hypothetical protein